MHNIDISEKLIQRMNEMNLRSVDIATQLGVSKGTVSHWRSGRSVPDGENLVGLCEILGVDVTWLVSTPIKSPMKSSSIRKATSNREIIQKYALKQPIDKEINFINSYTNVTELKLHSNARLVSSTIKLPTLILGQSLPETVEVFMDSSDDDANPNILKPFYVYDTAITRIIEDKFYVLQSDNGIIVRELSKTYRGEVLIKHPWADNLTEVVDIKSVNILGIVIWYGFNPNKHITSIRS